MSCDIATKICEAHCCAATLADSYVYKASKGRATEQDYFTLLLVDSYLDSLDRYKNTVSLSTGCTACGSGSGGSCLTEGDVRFILAQISIVCGGCTCNCD